MQMILFPTDHANSKIIQNRIQLTLFGPSTQYFYYKNPSINPIQMIIASSNLTQYGNQNLLHKLQTHISTMIKGFLSFLLFHKNMQTSIS